MKIDTLEEFEKQARKVCAQLEALHDSCVGKDRRPFDINQFEMGRAAIIADTLRSAHEAGRRDVLNEVLVGIAREQSYREFREDQDGSGIGACKEIAGYVRALLAGKGEK